MISSTRVTYSVAAHKHDEYLDQTAKIRELKRERREGFVSEDKAAHRRMTAARLTSQLVARLSHL
jgi:hypothetical protein